jgi:hypothetical protein
MRLGALEEAARAIWNSMLGCESSGEGTFEHHRGALVSLARVYNPSGGHLLDAPRIFSSRTGSGVHYTHLLYLRLQIRLKKPDTEYLFKTEGTKWNFNIKKISVGDP